MALRNDRDRERFRNDCGRPRGRPQHVDLRSAGPYGVPADGIVAAETGVTVTMNGAVAEAPFSGSPGTFTRSV